MINLTDVQNSKAERLISIDKVGVKDVRYPITLRIKEGGIANTVAKVSMYVHLSERFKGTHMSRFIEILNEYHNSIDLHMIKDILIKLRNKLNAEISYFELSFPYFIQKKAPVSKLPGLMDYNCIFSGFMSKDQYKSMLEVEVNVTSCCPCSKEISDRGAHNQRSIISIKVDMSERSIWIEDIINIAEKAGSSELYPLLKRPDEKFVTELAYDHPMFVEDMVREATYKLKGQEITNFRVEVTSYESIHNHSAHATIQEGRFENYSKNF